MRTIIHIGQHKTGTTSIQHYLKKNKIGLARQGLYVPRKIVGFKHPSHFILNVYSLGKKRLSPMKEKLLSSKTPFFSGLLQKNLRQILPGIISKRQSKGAKM